MNRASVVAGVLALAVASAALAGDPLDESVIVSAHGGVRGTTLDDRAIYACARSMTRRMFPDAERVLVSTSPDNQVFGDVDDNVLPGYQMSILLKAADADTGKTLGTAECDVTPDAKVVSLESTVATVATSE
jgi:hypothetical protein